MRSNSPQLDRKSMVEDQQVKKDIIIAPGDVAHAEQIELLSEQLGYPSTLVDIQQRITAIATSPNDVVYVALQDQQLVGWMHAFFTLRIESAPFCEIGGLVVHQDRRNKGIGALLVQQAKLWCRQRGIHSLRVRSNVLRKEAHAFYIRQGFKEVKKQSVFEIEV